MTPRVASRPTLARVLLSLGSNRAPEENLPRAVRALADHGRVLSVSAAYETQPVDTADPAPFLNAAVLLETGETPERLKGEIIPAIEARLGRRRDPGDRNAPRTIDIDIALWNDHVGRILERPVPDPDVLSHLHVAWPLSEIAPDLRHPVDGRTLAAIAGALVHEGALPILRHDVILRA
ncbi:MAG: 2-amino-4-hydroxy-6-hydroxymethyldihydropteridine diphosphokinase [Candidatus Krumholzibacteriia bacterium]